MDKIQVSAAGLFLLEENVHFAKHRLLHLLIKLKMGCKSFFFTYWL